MVSGPVRFITPAWTARPGSARRGADSPETIEQSRSEAPCSTTPSIGMRSPAATRMSAPGAISATGVKRRRPSGSTTVAPAGASRASPATAERARSRIMWSSVRPISRKKTSEVAASK